MYTTKEGMAEQTGKVNNTREAFWRLLKPYHSDSGKAVLEITRNWVLICDWLKEILGNDALANPLRLRVFAEARIKTGKIRADFLCEVPALTFYLNLMCPTRRRQGRLRTS